MTEPVLDAAEVRKIVAGSSLRDVRGYQGRLHLGEAAGRRVYVKVANGNALAAFIRRRMLKREYRAYLRLAGLPGVPRCFGLYDDRYLVVEAIEGQTLRHAAIPDRERFYSELRETIEAVHSRGVAHGDLTRRDNIIVDEGGHPVLVDFGVSTIYRPGLHPANHMAYRFFSQHDLNAWLKHKYHRRLDLMSPEDARIYRRLRSDVLARWIKRGWKTLRG